jgi:hypothetical protein
MYISSGMNNFGYYCNQWDIYKGLFEDENSLKNH